MKSWNLETPNRTFDESYETQWTRRFLDPDVQYRWTIPGNYMISPIPPIPSITTIQTFSLTTNSLTVRATTENIPSSGNVIIFTNTINSSPGATSVGTVTASQLNSGTTLSGTFSDTNTYYVFFQYPSGTFINSPTSSYKIPVPVQYPPTGLTSNTTVISGQVYGNGTYTTTASLSYPGQNPYNAFDYNTATLWGSDAYPGGGGGYSLSSPYQYVKGVYFTNIGGTSVGGEWLEIVLPVSITVTSYSIQSRNDTYWGQTPGGFYLTGFNGTNYTSLDRRTGITWSGSSQIKTFTVTGASSYSTIRIVVTNTSGGSPGPAYDFCSMAELILFGY